MSSSAEAFAGSIPEDYDQHLVPLIFAPYAQDMAARAAKSKPRHLLETAAGTGAVTRAVALALPDAHVTATDLNPGMLAVGQARAGNDPRMTWLQADATALPFAEGAFDCVVCQFGVMFFPDKVKGFAEARRVLRPAGPFLFSVWDKLDANVIAAAVTRALGALFPADPPLFLERVPHGYHDIDMVRADLRAAGFSGVDVERVSRVCRCPSPEGAAFAFCHGSPLRADIMARDPDGLARVTDAVAAALAREFGRGAIEGSMTAIVFEARA